jgi:hypothetical protein
MLPDRSKRYAGVDGEIARLQLAADWQLVLVAVLVVALLTAIFPRKALVEKLYQQQTLDDLTLSYVKNLYRTNPNNADAILLLAKTKPDFIDVPKLESAISGLLASVDLRQRNEARTVLFHAYMDRLNKKIDKSEEARLNAQLALLIQSARDDELPDHLARSFAEEAFRLNWSEVGIALFKRLNVDISANALERFADLALGRGQYAIAAKYYFMAREKADSLPEVRRLYQLGVRTMMAANAFVQAMADANSKLGDLAADPPTLRFLIQAALAAGDPIAAARFARMLVFK